MKIPYSLPPGPILDFANAVQRAFDRQVSVRLATFSTVSDLPNAAQWDAREVIVRDIDGGGTIGKAIALDGAWYDINGGAL